MAGSYVRKTVKAMIANANPSAPFYDTINLEQNPQDPRWMTVEYNTESSKKSTFCLDTEETGVIDLVFQCEAGAGDDVIEACELDAEKVARQLDPNGRLKFTRVQPADEFNHTTQRYFQVIIGLEYSYYSKGVV